MRIGTIFGKDIEKAMKRYDEIIWTEGFLEHPTLPICGSFDVLFVDEDANGHLIDIKTAHDFKYRGMFGRKKDPNPATNYQMQLGTYAWMLNETKKYCEKRTYYSKKML